MFVIVWLLRHLLHAFCGTYLFVVSSVVGPGPWLHPYLQSDYQSSLSTLKDI